MRGRQAPRPAAHGGSPAWLLPRMGVMGGEGRSTTADGRTDGQTGCDPALRAAGLTVRGDAPGPPWPLRGPGALTAAAGRDLLRAAAGACLGGADGRGSWVVGVPKDAKTWGAAWGGQARAQDDTTPPPGDPNTVAKRVQGSPCRALPPRGSPRPSSLGPRRARNEPGRRGCWGEAGPRLPLPVTPGARLGGLWAGRAPPTALAQPRPPARPTVLGVRSPRPTGPRVRSRSRPPTPGRRRRAHARAVPFWGHDPPAQGRPLSSSQVHVPGGAAAPRAGRGEDGVTPVTPVTPRQTARWHGDDAGGGGAGRGALTGRGPGPRSPAARCPPCSAPSAAPAALGWASGRPPPPLGRSGWSAAARGAWPTASSRRPP